jgi:FAD/FMN-containing dehydrogenase
MDLSALAAFAEQVGPTGPVVPVGGRTQWDVGGPPAGSSREVVAPRGVVSHEPAEMIVRARAGTPVEELQAVVGEAGQMVPLDPEQPALATVGGVLAVGRSGIRRLRWGAVRDLVLEVTYVSAEGALVRGGAPVVKNVTGFDLCRVMVGSLGTLGILAEVVLRTFPCPRVARWFAAEAEPWGVMGRAYRPSSVLWDGRSTRVLLEGTPGDVGDEARCLGPEYAECGPPGPLPAAGRVSVRPSELARTCDALEPGTFVAEIGVGIVHLEVPAPPPAADPSTLSLAERLKTRFDPLGRLNPGRRVGLGWHNAKQAASA